jgi:hypothetical protein
MEIGVILERKVENIIDSFPKSKPGIEPSPDSHRSKCENILKELESIPKDGKYYKEYNGKRLGELETKNTNYQIHSIEISGKLRLVYELKTKENGDIIIRITDLGDHEHRGNSYKKKKRKR